jgi:hypothetical protein
LSPKLPFAILALAAVLGSCGEMPSTLPSAVGGIDEILFVEDPRFSEDSLYGVVDRRLTAQYGNFLHHEPIFDLLHLPLANLDKSLANHRNILYVGVMDKPGEYNDQLMTLLGEAGVQKVRSGELFSGERKDVWALGQHVHIIAAPTYEVLEQGLDRALDALVPRIQDAEFAKIRRNVYASGEETELMRELENEQGIRLRIPRYYQKHPSSEGNFTWYRRSTVDLTASIMVYQHPYRRELEISPAYAIFVRDSLGKHYERSQIEKAYMTTEKLVRPLEDTVDFNGHFAIRTQSLWRLEYDFMGGPFIHYLIYDPRGQRVIHLDAYVYAPDITRKRKLMREMDAILQTFALPEP